MTGVEWRRGIIFDAKLNGSRGHFSGDFGHHGKTEIDASGYAAGGDQIAVPHNPAFLIGRADQR